MSAKGRRKGEDIPFEYFPTPAWCVHRLLDGFGRDLLRGVERVLEPNVGDGSIVRAVEAWRAEERPMWRASSKPLAWTGVELRRAALTDGTPLEAHHEGEDFRAWAGTTECFGFDLAIGNPPYSLAESIVRKAMESAKVVAMLLRVGFLGSAERLPFWRQATPLQEARAHLNRAVHAGTVGLYVLPDRPSFDGDGTDAATYAWFVWGHPMLTGIHHLDTTPKAVRAAQRPRTLPRGLPQLGLGLEVA